MSENELEDNEREEKDQKSEDAHKYAQRQSAVALDKEKSSTNWHNALQADPGLYGDSDEKDAFLAREAKEMEQRSRAWGQLSRP